MKNKKSLIPIFLILFFLFSCEEQRKDEKKVSVQTPKDAPAPVFNEDSAYFFIEKQVKFGPRVPNTRPHVLCGDYLINTLKKYGLKVHVQSFEAKAFDGTSLRLRNIIASFNPEAQKRILLGAHWDTRPFADRDKENRDKPIAGANDGGSGVGVLLEIARILGQQKGKLNTGVDIIFFDGEDYGQPEDYNGPYKPDSWCLGSQYWAKNKHKPGYSAYYGILLDMVGAKNAKFAMEGTSMQYAPSVMKKVWDTAHRTGFGEFFIYQQTAPITDDHTYINQIAKIPMIDIIEYEASGGNYFGNYWHTHEDNMDIIDRRTLKAVGQTVLQVLFNE